MAQIVVSSKPAVAVPGLTALTRLSCEMSDNANRMRAALSRIARVEGAPIFDADKLCAAMNEGGVGNAIDAMAYGWERCASQWLAWIADIAMPALRGVFMPSLPPSIQAKRSDPTISLLVDTFEELSTATKMLRQTVADLAKGRGHPVFDAQTMRDELVNVHKIHDPSDALAYGWAMAAQSFALWATAAAKAANGVKP